jgi:hypothetical protein
MAEHEEIYHHMMMGMETRSTTRVFVVEDN